LNGEASVQTAEIAQLKSRLTSLSAQIENERMTTSTAERRSSDERAALQRSINDTNALLAAKNEEIALLTARIDALTSTMSTNNNQSTIRIEQLVSERASLSERVASLQARMAVMDDERQQWQQIADDSRTTLDNERKRYDDERRERLEQINKLQNELSAKLLHADAQLASKEREKSAMADQANEQVHTRTT
jgi:chromosome segregation ATPase